MLRHQYAVGVLAFSKLRQVFQHHKREYARGIGGSFDRSHVVIGVSPLMLAGTEIRGRDTDVVEISLVEGRWRIIGFSWRAQHDLAAAQKRTHDRRIC